MAGVRCWMSWLALFIAALIARPHRLGLAIVGVFFLVWTVYSVRFVLRSVKAGADLLDIDVMLCLVALALTVAVPLIVAAFRLHIPRPVSIALIFALLFGVLATLALRRRRV